MHYFAPPTAGRVGHVLCVGMITLLALAAAVAPASAQNPRHWRELVERLKPPPKTDELFRSWRGIKVDEGQIREADLPSVSLTVNFEYNSAQLTTDARDVLWTLATALRDNALTTYKFRVAGHTDAVGGEEFNKQLSQRRAEAVIEFLVGTFGIDRRRLEPIGFGKTQLARPDDPNSEHNRRVEIKTIGLIN